MIIALENYLSTHLSSFLYTPRGVVTTIPLIHIRQETARQVLIGRRQSQGTPIILTIKYMMTFGRGKLQKRRNVRKSLCLSYSNKKKCFSFLYFMVVFCSVASNVKEEKCDNFHISRPHHPPLLRFKGFIEQYIKKKVGKFENNCLSGFCSRDLMCFFKIFCIILLNAFSN